MTAQWQKAPYICVTPYELRNSLWREYSRGVRKIPNTELNFSSLTSVRHHVILPSANSSAHSTIYDPLLILIPSGVSFRRIFDLCRLLRLFLITVRSPFHSKSCFRWASCAHSASVLFGGIGICIYTNAAVTMLYSRADFESWPYQHCSVFCRFLCYRAAVPFQVSVESILILRFNKRPRWLSHRSHQKSYASLAHHVYWQLLVLWMFVLAWVTNNVFSSTL